MLILNCFDINEVTSIADYELLYSMATDDRKKKAKKYCYFDDTKRCICAEILLKYCLYKQFDYKGDINIEYNQFGKPFMKKIKNFSFNISHSGDWVVCAYGKSELGVDIEKIQSKTTEIIEKCFSKYEQEYVNNSFGKERENRVIQIWTLKESYIKYFGIGLTKRLNSYSVCDKYGEIIDKLYVNDEQIFLENYLFDSNYYLATCSKENNAIINRVHLSDILLV